MTDDNQTVENVVSESQPAVAIPQLRSSEQIDKLAAALAKAQGEMKHPGKNKTATVPMKNGGKYSYNYADLADVLDALRGPFAANGLSLLQVPFNDGPRAVGVITRIMHSSGQWMEAPPLFMPCGDGRPQDIGSAITYGRRYTASPMAGITSDDDDDGNAAQGNAADTGPRQRGDGPPPSGVQASRPNSLPPATAKMLAAFTELSVTKDQIIRHCNGVALEAMTEAELGALKTLYAEVKAGTVKAADVGAKKDTKAALNERFKK